MQVKPPASRVAIPPPTKHRAVLGQLSDMDLRLLQVFINPDGKKRRVAGALACN